MPYNPYQGGWGVPSWWQQAPTQRQWEGLYPGEMRGQAPGWETKNLVGFLNALLPLMRTKEDMLALGRQISTLTQGRGQFGGYGTATTGGQYAPESWGTPSQAWFPEAWQGATGAIQHQGPGDWEPYVRSNERLRAWLNSVMSGAQQYGKVPAAPAATQAPRGQEAGFQRELGRMLEGGPEGSEAYAPWIKRLFLPTLGRRVPGTYAWSPEQQRGYVTQNPRFW